LDFASEEGVVFYFLSHKDHTIASNSISRLPGNFSILLFLAVNDRGYGVSLDADSKSVPFAVGQASTEFDDLPLTSMDALIVKFELAADL
jgi:hypothetical protein